MSLAQELLPTLNDLQVVLFDSLMPLPLPSRLFFTTAILCRINKVFISLDNAPKWNEKKSKWPANTDGPVVSSGRELLEKAEFALSLYEYCLMMSLEDLILATIVLPDFAQSWRRVGDALMELNKFKAAIDYYEAAFRVDESLAPVLLPVSCFCYLNCVRE